MLTEQLLERELADADKQSGKENSKQAMWPVLILVAKSKGPSQTACFMTYLKGEIRVCSGTSPRSQLMS